ncbi:DinB family protein [Paenibacillus sp. GCM10023248]|uniref:DinB family protein n=1 Tax=Bacillales TaxID=1385 RepID=UPI002379BCFB|nr:MULTISPECIES: DinB family protein [Bacillales]MDD9266398.1 DinB family protein [Paenibacillus sp. MAHUQ-63]MDR6878523.1 putative damage-inducible protein DinB [Bacillus sp. 3255]
MLQGAQEVRKMYDFHVWANQTMLTHLRKLGEDIYRQEVQSVFRTVAQAMAHIYIVDAGWLDMMSGKSMHEAMADSRVLTPEVESKTMQEIEVMYAELADRFQAFLRSQEDLGRTIVLDNPYAGVRDTSLAEMILQVVNHGTYHRGNVTAMLRQMGHASVMTEYALFWYAG